MPSNWDTGSRASVVHEMLELRKKKPFVVSSLHNFCPLPPEVMVDQPDCYEFTSDRPGDRERAVRLTLQTIDMAERFEAPVVVVHTGRIRALKLTRALRGLVEEGEFLSKEFARVKLEAVKESRERWQGTYARRALECLAEILAYASKKGIRIGIENREHYEAVPSEREFEDFLQLLNSPNARILARFRPCADQAKLGFARPCGLARSHGHSRHRLSRARREMAVRRSSPTLHRRD